MFQRLERIRVIMRQYTNESQTAKLIELGFDKPKFEIETQMCNVKGQPLRVATIVGDYSIGELIEMLPQEFRNAKETKESVLRNGSCIHFWERNE